MLNNFKLIHGENWQCSITLNTLLSPVVRWPSDCKLDCSIKHVAALLQDLVRDFSYGISCTTSICFSLFIYIKADFQRCCALQLSLTTTGAMNIQEL